MCVQAITIYRKHDEIKHNYINKSAKTCLFLTASDTRVRANCPRATAMDGRVERVQDAAV